MVRTMRAVLFGVLIFSVVLLCALLTDIRADQSPLPTPTLWVTPTGYVLGFTSTPTVVVIVETFTPQPTSTPLPTAIPVPAATSLPHTPIILLPKTGEDVPEELSTGILVGIAVTCIFAAVLGWVLAKRPTWSDDEFRRGKYWGEG